MLEMLHREAVYLWYYFCLQLSQIFRYWVLGSAISVFAKEYIHGLFRSLGGKRLGVLGIFIASTLGIASPLCMYGTIPLAASFSESGMEDDWLAAFMMSSILLNPQLILYSMALGNTALAIRIVSSFVCGAAAGLLMLALLLSACSAGAVSESTGVRTTSGDGAVTSREGLTFPIGAEVPFNGKGYLAPMIASEDVYNFPQTNNITFEPGARSDWHTHGGMVILVTGGVGYYQEEGKPAQIIRRSDVLEIAPGVKHWHGAAPDSTFAHIAANTNPERPGVEWFDRISKVEYSRLGAGGFTDIPEDIKIARSLCEFLLKLHFGPKKTADSGAFLQFGAEKSGIAKQPPKGREVKGQNSMLPTAQVL